MLEWVWGILGKDQANGCLEISKLPWIHMLGYGGEGEGKSHYLRWGRQGIGATHILTLRLAAGRGRKSYYLPEVSCHINRKANLPKLEFIVVLLISGYSGWI